MESQPPRLPKKYCEHCEKFIRPLVYGNGYTESSSSYARRRFCSLQCFHTARRKPAPLVRCQTCRIPISKAPYESLAQFKKRKFCSHKCHGATTANPEGPTHGGLPHRGRKVARRVKPRKACEQCGTSKRLEIHHRDGDATNNEPANLQVLCLRCHRAAHKTHGCKVSNCGSPHCALGFCSKHYYRFKKYGDPLLKRANSHAEPTKVST